MSIQVINSKLECDFKEIEKHLDSSFDKINNFIDQLFILDFPISKFNNQKSELQLQLPTAHQFHLIGQSQFQSNILQELQPLINSKINHQLQIQLQSDEDYQQSQSQQLLIQDKLLKPFTYQLIKDNFIKQVEDCYAIAFNNECSIVAAGCNSQIKIYEFRQGMLKQIQILNEHKGYATTLNFMKKSNQFVSGDNDGSILIWSKNNNNLWVCSQTVKEHNCRINYLIMNNNEDIIITGSDDKTIKFGLSKMNGSVNKQSQIIMIVFINQVQMKNKIKQFHVDGIHYYQQLSIQNRIKMDGNTNIKVDCQGWRICFINDNQFTFQPKTGNLMHVYEMNGVSKQFTKTKDIIVNQGDDSTIFFPQQFIKLKQLLVHKHNGVNLIRKTENDEFKVEQYIQFGSNSLFWQMSDDGEYLITWDNQSQEIQIRKYTEQ